MNSGVARAKSSLKQALAAFGLEIRRTSPPPPPVRPEPLSSAYHNAMIVLMAEQARQGSLLRIVQIGANDGLINDPLYALVHQFPEGTDMLLIEPQAMLIEPLSKNYAFHPRHTIFNEAIGEGPSLELFSVKQAYWDKIDAPYAAGWPAYRAPSGITSSDRAMVAMWLRKYQRGTWDVEDAIERTVVPCSNLESAIERSGFGTPVDVLQVDAEGFDDVVLYNSSVDKLRPRIICFEAKSLDAARYTKLVSYLNELGYHTSRQGVDALAVLTMKSSARAATSRAAI